MEKNVLEHECYGRVDRYEIVDLWPMSHQIWNIGRHNFPFPGYVPLCVCDETYHVNTDYLKCIKLESEEIASLLMKIAGHVKAVDRPMYEMVKDTIAKAGVGEEAYQMSTSTKWGRKKVCCYAYRHYDGEVFADVQNSVELCRKYKEWWLAEKERSNNEK